MGQENKNNAIHRLFKKHNNVMTTAELSSNKIYYADIQNLLRDGKIEKVRRGYYHYIEDFSGSEVSIINRLFPDAVLCMETALFYYGYSDRNPAEWNIAIDKNTSRYRTKIDYPFIKDYRLDSAIIKLGESQGTIDGERVRIYDRERTICDVLHNLSKMDKEIFNKAITSYVNDSKKNIPNLLEYAKVLRVSKKVRDLIGVWL